MRDPIEFRGRLYDRIALVEYVDETGKDIYGKPVCTDELCGIPTNYRVKQICDQVWKK